MKEIQTFGVDELKGRDGVMAYSKEYKNTSREARLRRAVAPGRHLSPDAISNNVTAGTAKNDDYQFKFDRGTTANQV